MPEDNDVRKSSSERVLSTQQSNAFRGANQVRAQQICKDYVDFGKPKSLNFARDYIDFGKAKSLSEVADMSKGYKAVDDLSPSYKGSDDN